MDLSVCNICCKFYSSRSALRKHWLQHIEGSKYSCHLCSKNFLYKASYAKHLKYHKLKPKRKSAIKKSKSKRQFKSKKTSSKSNQCGKTKCKISNKKVLSNKFKKLKCELCSWICNDYSSMKQHVIGHGAKEIIGDMPSTTRFLDNYKAKTYIVFHCKDCNFSCEKRKDLWSHLKLHILKINVKKIKCNKCKLDFSSISELKMHMKKHLSTSNQCSDSIEKEKKYFLKTYEYLTKLFNCNQSFDL